MPRNLRHRLALFAVALCAFGAQGAWAGRHGDGGRGNMPPADGGAYYQPAMDPRNGPGNDPAGPGDDGLPASVRRIQRQTGGQVLRAQPYERDGREVYRVKVLTPQGRIRVYEDDPSTRNAPPPAYPRAPQAQYPAPYQGPPSDRAPAYPGRDAATPAPPPPRYQRPPRDAEPNDQRPPSRPPAAVYQRPPQPQYQPPPGRRRGG